ncbi:MULTISPECIES: V-type ATP synthase subunit D [Persephonella]|uniref:V-type ATPase, D subunit n=1 Tax=Persephonella marina (strain DSM 14350 / EX-H1) TaxID=123214 RepID=C0QT23_PERMH|nr:MULTISPECIES: V-type ATP synthase subunit D [Persephonella]ACO04742.1 V-type ATPase, D subunit [Persephonella marina EX-H1]
MIRYTKNKTDLLELKKELSIIKDGKDILEQKRDILLKEILSIIDQVEAYRKRLNEVVQKSYNLLIKAYMEAGKDYVLRESKISVFKGDLKIYEKSFMGIPIPEVKYKVYRVKTPLNPVSEYIFVDLARNSFMEAVRLILEVASTEIKAWKLAEELKKTVVRVNALEHFYIPEYEKAVKEISDSLEEMERELLILIKNLGSEELTF